MRALGIIKISLFYLAIFGVALAAIAAKSDLRGLYPAPTWSAWLAGLGLGLGVGLAVVGFTRLSSRWFRWAARLSEEFRGLLGELNAREALVVALLSSIGEETLFRGLLQPALGLWLGSAVFGLLHVGPNPRFLPWTVMAFFAGLIFGGLCLWTGNLLAATVAHTTINFLNLCFLAERPQTAVLQFHVRVDPGKDQARAFRESDER
jgi:uncharacterized protein